MTDNELELLTSKILNFLLGKTPTREEIIFLTAKVKNIAGLPIDTHKTVQSLDTPLLPAIVSRSPVQDPDIYYAYKFFLGRIPEHDDVYKNKKMAGDIDTLLNEIVSSAEFKANPILKSQLSVKRTPIGYDKILQTNASTQSGRKTVAVISGCQGKMLADLFQVQSDLHFVPHYYSNSTEYASLSTDNGEQFLNHLKTFDLIYTQKIDVFNFLQKDADLAHRVQLMPLIECTYFHPDQIYVADRKTSKFVVGPLGDYQSLILTAAYFSGYTQQQAQNLFCEKVYSLFGYNQLGNQSLNRLSTHGESFNYPMKEMITRWNSQGPWMRTMNHPKKFVLSSIVEHALRLQGLTPHNDVAQYVTDDLSASVEWPIYPNLVPGINGTFRFKMPRSYTPHANAASFLDLPGFIDATYRSLHNLSINDITLHRLNQEIEIKPFIDILESYLAPDT